MLRLLSLLQSGRAWTATELARAAECTPRTLRRDIEYLRGLGYPVRSLRGPGGHYQLVAGRSLPPLMLDDDEAIATVLGLRLAAAGRSASGTTTETAKRSSADHAAEAAARAEGKLRRILPAGLRKTTDTLLAALDVATTSPAIPDPALLQRLTHAITKHRTVRFAYTGKRGATERHVEPARLVRLQQRWYLLAWDRDRGDWRTFRLDRADEVAVTETPFAQRRLPADDLVGYLRERFTGLPEHTVVLTLAAGAQEAATRLYRVDGTLEPLSDGTCRYTANVDSYEWLVVVLVLSDVEFTVEQPDAFRDYLRTQAGRLARACVPRWPRRRPPAGTHGGRRRFSAHSARSR